MSIQSPSYDRDRLDDAIILLREGELGLVMRLHRNHSLTPSNPESIKRFIDAVRECVEIRLLLPGMTPQEIIGSARELVGEHVGFYKELSLVEGAREAVVGARDAEDVWRVQQEDDRGNGGPRF